MKQTSLFQVKANDGYMLDVKVDYPIETESIVIFCHGSGANTYDNRREVDGVQFCYFDLFAEEFCKRNIAFCRWNTRGCSVSDNPPDFTDINENEYETYCPSTSVSDILAVTDFIKGLSEFKEAKILFMGISEGATLIPFAAQQCKHEIAGLLLLGFSYENMKDTMEWQLTGGSSMVNMCKYFDCAEKGYIEKEDFEADKYQVRPALFPDTIFEDLDLDKDGKITQNDFALQLAEYKENVFRAIEEDDNEWLRENYSVLLTSKWFKEHFALPKVSTVLCSIDIPIYIFQGEEDANIPMEDIAKIQADFETMGKRNLQVFTFPKHDHDLNYLHFPLAGVVSEGLLCVFNTAKGL